MTELLNKLQFTGQIPILVVDPPPSFDEKRTSLEILTAVHSIPENGYPYSFCLTFAKKQEDLLKAARKLNGNLAQNAVVWFASPAPGSTTVQTDLTPELCQCCLEPFGLVPEKTIALDNDWIVSRYCRKC